MSDLFIKFFGNNAIKDFYLTSNRIKKNNNKKWKHCKIHPRSINYSLGIGIEEMVHFKLIK